MIVCWGEDMNVESTSEPTSESESKLESELKNGREEAMYSAIVCRECLYKSILRQNLWN